MALLLKPKITKKVSKVTAKVKELDERDLERYLFDQNHEQVDDLRFFIDTGDTSDAAPMEVEEPSVWHDEDEVEVNIQRTNRLKKLRTDYNETIISSKDYEKRLRNQFEKINPTPSWATAKETNSVLTTTRKLVQTKQINPDKLVVTRVSDANQQLYTKGAVQVCQFHPTAPVLLTAGFDKRLTLFHIDEKENPQVETYMFKDMPVFSANFTPDGNEIFVTGRRNFFYNLDLDNGTTNRIHSIQGRDEKSLEKSYVSKCGEYLCILGTDGTIIMVSRKTKKWVANVKMNTMVVSLGFTKEHMWSLGLDGTVYQWDIKTKRCLHKFTDQGAVKSTVITISDDEQWIAVGSMMGIVNVYSLKSCLESDAPEPSKVLMNLTTAITSLQFHPSSDLLAFASHDVKDALRLYHLPTQRVIKNWPTSNTPLAHVETVSFSPTGTHIAIGNGKGKVLLYRIEAFS